MTKYEKQYRRTSNAIAKAARARRVELGLSPAKLAERAGISRPTVLAVESGKLGSASTLHKQLYALQLELRCGPMGVRS
jgi:transcriptional regulator with XRE-family HTH domain